MLFAPFSFLFALCSLLLALCSLLLAPCSLLLALCSLLFPLSSLPFSSSHPIVFFLLLFHPHPTPLPPLPPIPAQVTIVDPHIKRDTGYAVHRDAQSRGVYVRDKSGSGEFDGWCWPGSSSYVDYTSKDSRDWWADQFALSKYDGSTHNLYTWNDMNEPSVFNGPEVTMQKDNKNRDGVEHREWHNLFGFYMQMATTDGHVRSRRETNGGVFLCLWRFSLLSFRFRCLFLLPFVLFFPFPFPFPFLFSPSPSPSLSLSLSLPAFLPSCLPFCLSSRRSPRALLFPLSHSLNRPQETEADTFSSPAPSSPGPSASARSGPETTRPSGSTSPPPSPCSSPSTSLAFRLPAPTSGASSATRRPSSRRGGTSSARSSPSSAATRTTTARGGSRGSSGSRGRRASARRS